ncbi:uncharacterized protein N7511_005182 [Penicillium nucicola]|uniref:uncharacterized protein n=1 Tax=Penicillium nucicola TaxID=1850975 RepID=UPI002545A45D|nr:uncharacterized protein N7511_005182 [Penicillium nucicola]KAJ5761800.1 hypothetical protein N7511_005182 [Penicillium nucicola]
MIAVMEKETPESRVIALATMPQRAGARCAEDDWTGVIDRKERRKLQNRLSQRRYRLKQRDTTSSYAAAPISATTALVRSASTVSSPFFINASDTGLENTFQCANAPPHALHFRQWVETTAYHNYLHGSPKTDQLISLSRVNVHRAINENIAAIGMTTDWMKSDDSISIFNLAQPGFTVEGIPPALQPTAVQTNIPHHPWLDFFPFQGIRDRLILAGDSFDDDDLCHDLMAFWDTRNTAATLLVWGNSWEPKNWEVTENFARKWKWLLLDSPGLLASTNVWRKSRAEPPLNWREILR